MESAADQEKLSGNGDCPASSRGAGRSFDFIRRRRGAESTDLKIESRLDPRLIESLKALGHDIAVVSPFEEMMGYAGAMVHDSDGLLNGASDPRSDGVVAAIWIS